MKGRILFYLFLLTLGLACKQKRTQNIPLEKTPSQIENITYAKGFTIENHDDIKIIKVRAPWPEAKKTFTYAVIPREKISTLTYPKDYFDAVVLTPINSLIVTSTTHIPALEELNSLDKLIGFPQTNYISSKKARTFINNGQIQELGQNERLNTEITLSLKPEIIVGFAIDNSNSPYETFQNVGIPVVFNGDWVEQTPLGKAEWIKFFGALLDKEKEADSIFKNIETNYNAVKDLAKKGKKTPSVISGALYKDVWYAPAGDSWAAQFFNDANANYMYADTKGTGSLSLSIENVLAKGATANYWIGTAQFESYDQMNNSNTHYSKFEAFKNKKLYSFANTTGETGGILYYELGPQRPDLVLKDLVKILHPQVLPNYSPYFFTPLQ